MRYYLYYILVFIYKEIVRYQLVRLSSFLE